MYTVELVNRQSLGESKEVEIINEPTLTEEINAAYTFDFEAHYAAKSDFSSDVLVKVEGQYFQIARVVKNRQNNLSLSVQCEHVSYELIDAEDVTEEYEDTALGMLASILSGTHFTLGTCMGTSTQYYKPSSLEVRQRLIDVANLFGGELVFDNFTVSLVPQRGSNKGLKVELGVNLLGVTEEIDYVEGTTAYELDLVDLAEVFGYELDFSSAEIGDTIEIIDPELGIHASERILSIQRNPFKPQLPVVTVGDYIRDLTEYFREEEEEKEEDDDPRANYYLEKFQIGDVDCLNLNGVEVDNDEALPEGITAKLDFMLFEKLKSVSLQLKPKYKTYHITVYKVYEDGGFETLDYAANQSAINSWLLPTERITGIGILITSTPFTIFDVDKDDFKQYGINFNRVIIDVLREFKIGKMNALGLSGIEIFPEMPLPDEIEAEIKYEELGEHKGLFLSLKKAYRDWYVKLTAYDAEGIPTHYNFADIKDEAAAWALPSGGISAIAITAMEQPPERFNSDEHLQAQYGVKFTSKEDDEEEEPSGSVSDYLSEFRIGTEDMLPIASDETQSVIDFIEGRATEVVPSATFEAGENEHTGVFAQLTQEYAEYYLTVIVSMKAIDGMKGTELMPWEEVKSGVAQMPILPPGITYYAFTFVVSDIPFAKLTSTNADSAFIKAFGVTAGTVDESEPEPTDLVRYAYVDGDDWKSIRGMDCYRVSFINNITNFHENFIDENFWFETDPLSTKYYPAAYGLFFGYNTLVQIVDGVITAVLTNLDVS